MFSVPFLLLQLPALPLYHCLASTAVNRCSPVPPAWHYSEVIETTSPAGLSGGPCIHQHPCPHRQLTQQQGPFWQPPSSSCPAHLPPPGCFQFFHLYNWLLLHSFLILSFTSTIIPALLLLQPILRPPSYSQGLLLPQARLRGHEAGQILSSSPAGVPALSSQLIAPYLWPPCLFSSPEDCWPSCTPFPGLLEVSIHGFRKQHGWEPYSAVSMKWCFLKISEFQWVDIKVLLWRGLFPFLIKVSGFGIKLFKS